MNWSNYFCYDETSPSFLRWKVKRGKVKKGDVAGSGVDRPYWQVCLKRKLTYSHRIVWELFHGPIPKGYEVDHKNRDAMNGEITNLRLVSRKVNCRNVSKRCNNTSGVTGLYRRNAGRFNYWIAHWQGIKGGTRQKFFNVTLLGEEQAFFLAGQYRAYMIEQLNRLGAGYTETHGK